jgi:hypothetical protein
MRILLLMLWLLVPVGALAYHFGPGQAHLQMDTVAAILKSARADVAEQRWGAAQAAFEQALAQTPETETRLRQELRLEVCKSQMLNRQLPTAHDSLLGLMEEVSNDPTAPPSLVQEVRASLASSQYYLTWLMRLEGQPREKWEPEVEAARQNYALLAEQAAESGDTGSLKLRKEDLESAVRLARMDLGELQGLPLPNQ